MSVTAAAAPDSLLQRIVILVAATLPAALYVGTQTIANAVLPQLQGDFSAALDQITWVVTVSVVAGAIAIPPTTWLAGRFGRRQLLIAGMSGFALASVWAGMAGSLFEVVIARAAAAICGASAIALSQAITLDTFPPSERGAAFSFWSIGVLVGWIFAPALGAWLAELYSWRLIFFALAPLGVLAALGCLLIPEAERRAPRHFDWVGFVSLSVALGAILVILNRGQRLDWFEATEIVMWGVAAAIAVYLVIVHSLTSDKRLIRWAVFRDRNFAVGLALIFGYAHMNLAPLVLIPTMLEELRGIELLTTGLVLIPRGLAQMLGMMFVWSLTRHLDGRVVIAFGLVAFSASSWIMTGYNLDVGLWDIVWPNVMQGLAMSLIWIPLINLTYVSLPAELRVDGAVLVSLVYSTSASAGVALGVTILGRSAQIAHEELAGQAHPMNELLRFPQYSEIWDLFDTESAAAIGVELSRQALMIGYVNVYYAVALLSLCLVPLALLLRK